MVERRTPTARYLLARTGGEDPPAALRGQGPLLQRTYRGLADVSLGGVYSHLDLDEALAFAAGSRALREGGNAVFRGLVAASSLYAVFSAAWWEGYPPLQLVRTLPPDGDDRLNQLHENLNPFHGKGAKRRLDGVPEDVDRGLRKALIACPRDYVFEVHYPHKVVERGGDSSGVIIMGFQPVFPRRGNQDVIARNYAQQLARMFRKYPAAVVELSELQVSQPTAHSPAHQERLF